MVTEALKELRERYFICKGHRPLGEIAEAMGISRQALTRFSQGKDVSLLTIEQIEAWVKAQQPRKD